MAAQIGVFRREQVGCGPHGGAASRGRGGTKWAVGPGWADRRKRWESADKPGSVVDNHPSGTHVAARLERPTRKPLRAAGTGPKARVLPYLVLLQVGFAVPPNVATGAVRSYRTLSPLPSPHCCGAWAVCFLLHFPWARAPQALPGTLPCGARTFLRAVTQRLPGRLPRAIIPRALLAQRWRSERALVEFLARAAGDLRRELRGLRHRQFLRAARAARAPHRASSAASPRAPRPARRARVSPRVMSASRRRLLRERAERAAVHVSRIAW